MPTNCTTLLRATLLLLTVIGAVTSGYSQSGDAALVEQFFPQSLISESQTEFNNGGLPPVRHSSFVAADLNGTGQADFLVAAYTTNLTSAVVRVLRKQGTSATLVAEPAVPLMGGLIPEVSLTDLDGDARPEIVVRYMGLTGGFSTWIFKWTGTTLTPFGPTETDENGDITSVLNDAGFVDVTGDGIPEILNAPEHNSDDPTTTVYQLVGGVYTLTTTKIYYARPFVRGTAAPQTETVTFELDPTKPYVMIISNGNESGGNRASSVQVSLNGTEVAGTSQFNQQMRVLRLPVAVTNDNVLSVRFAGVPQSEITIAFATE